MFPTPNRLYHHPRRAWAGHKSMRWDNDLSIWWTKLETRERVVSFATRLNFHQHFRANSSTLMEHCWISLGSALTKETSKSGIRKTLMLQKQLGRGKKNRILRHGRVALNIQQQPAPAAVNTSHLSPNLLRVKKENRISHFVCFIEDQTYKVEKEASFFSGGLRHTETQDWQQSNINRE